MQNQYPFFNREISWIHFNFRVLEEASRADNPLLERLKFLAISESNLNEFFMVRVAGLKQVVASSVNEIQLDGKTAQETLQEIHKQVGVMVELQYRYMREIFAGLREKGIILIEDFAQLGPQDREFARQFFEHNVFRILTPLAIDPSHPFPLIGNGKLNMAVCLKRPGSDNDFYAIIEVPTVIKRFPELPPGPNGERRFIPLEEIIKLHSADLFSGTQVTSIQGFTITRNSDISIDEVASDNLLSTIEDELKQRRWGEAVRLSTRITMPANVRDFLRMKLDLEEEECFERPGLLNLQDLHEIANALQDRADLANNPFIPRNAVPIKKMSLIFQTIRKKDILLHHPYDSFQTVIDVLAYASRDPKTMAIKQTMYRTGGDSPLIESLIEAAENGKQVTVLMELKARFDEERNIVRAREMEQHGVHVVYGLVGLKIHGKMLQIIRREDDGVKGYCHLSTGNYNPNTARMYTDLALITADPQINNDVTNLFHALTGYSSLPKLERIAAAPINLREVLSSLVMTEIQNAEQGKPARIRLKMNALVDPDMIQLLYKAARAGVKIELNIRGICCLVPEAEGVEGRIRVISIVGRFLEHSRIFHFENGGNPKVFLASADWMPRNLNRRVEVMFPIQDEDHKLTILEVLDTIFRDDHNARLLLPNGTWRRLEPPADRESFSSQRFFRDEARRQFELKEKDRGGNLMFQPAGSPNGPVFSRLFPEDMEARDAREGVENDSGN
ncbi:MAG: polyphosphate kinase 1 [Leptospirales bacterium]|nr:polyphosphate kinase 1 [Leptospirales bacterium]